MENLRKAFEPGEIFQFVKKMNDKRKSKIVDVKNIFLLPDGTMAGVVKLEEEIRKTIGGWERKWIEWRCVPFKGDTIMDEIQGKKNIKNL